MDADALANLLGLPPASGVDRRIPKTLLAQHGATTAADRKLVTSSLESLTWVAALKPTTCGVAPFRDATREYAEIHVLRLEGRASPVSDRLRIVVHRAIPYPVLLLTVTGGEAVLSAVHVRWSQGAAGQTVVDGELEWAVLPRASGGAAWWPAARAELALTAQPTGDLFTLYDGWIESLLAVRAAGATTKFHRLRDPAAIMARRTALAECERLAGEMKRVRAAAKRTPQRARQVAYTAELRRLEQADRAALARL